MFAWLADQLRMAFCKHEFKSVAHGVIYSEFGRPGKDLPVAVYKGLLCVKCGFAKKSKI